MKTSKTATWTRNITPPPAPKFSPLPKGRKLTRDECAGALAERVAAGTMTPADAVAILKMFDEST